MSISAERVSQIIKEKALKHGFSYCGISKASFLEEEASRLETWLNEQQHGSMLYMERNFDKRLDPRLLVEGCKTVVSLIYNYYPDPILLSQKSSFKVSKYAWGKDYHLVVKEKMKELWLDLASDFGNLEGRMFVDSAPILEKAWAKKSGVGWIGKNANLIVPKKGSFFFISELLINLEASSDGPIKDFCGTCTRCIDACPTDAITPYQVDGSKCISYFTIELKESLPVNLGLDFQDWIFGCDICQDVCPWNRHSKAHLDSNFIPNETFLNLTNQDWEELSETLFKELFHFSAINRTKLSGIKRNIAYLKAKKNEP
jgi:epoxyqueuosine reductase